ncbi:MAG: hypothetical protein EXQ84_01010 [Rhodospirillaceae bacterium]|nr:hypothetical protein [Rhodospirillaceae bacterium]
MPANEAHEGYDLERCHYPNDTLPGPVLSHICLHDFYGFGQHDHERGQACPTLPGSGKMP